MSAHLIRYQVQIRIPKTIQVAYQAWLVDHVVGNPKAGIPGMLELKTAEGAPLFIKAEIEQANSPLHPDHCLYTVNYFMNDGEAMDYYEENFAAEMRTQLPEDFAGIPVVNRCIYYPDIIGTWDVELGSEQAAVQRWERVF